jgi:hypothetical protein
VTTTRRHQRGRPGRCRPTRTTAGASGAARSSPRRRRRRGTNCILVTHKPNILDAFGKDWFDVREGEASIFKPDGKGGFTLVGRVQAADWGEAGEDAVAELLRRQLLGFRLEVLHLGHHLLRQQLERMAPACGLSA